jgi:hypothetical protein
MEFHASCDDFCQNPLTWPRSLFNMYVVMRCLAMRAFPSVSKEAVADYARTLWLKHGGIYDQQRLMKHMNDHFASLGKNKRKREFGWGGAHNNNKRVFGV